MTLTGRDVHKAFIASFPYLQPSWDELPEFSKQGYEIMARELNKMLLEDKVTIQSVRCPNCNEMLESEHAEGHACWLKGEKT
jgi:hypothetical protein